MPNFALNALLLVQLVALPPSLGVEDSGATPLSMAIEYRQIPEIEADPLLRSIVVFVTRFQVTGEIEYRQEPVGNDTMLLKLEVEIYQPPLWAGDWAVVVRHHIGYKTPEGQRLRLAQFPERVFRAATREEVSATAWVGIHSDLRRVLRSIKLWHQDQLNRTIDQLGRPLEV